LAPDSSTAGLCPACLLTRALKEDDDLDASPDRAGLLPGTMLGPFRIVGLLGKGGMASVYEAYEAPLDRVVALKVLPPEFLHDETFAKRFTQEARIVASLEHANIVPIYASGIDAGIPWISMRLLTGGSLVTLLGRGGLDITRSTQILRGVAEALDYAHARGVIHRDVKPSNILLDEAGHVCVSDFGLARLMERGEGLTRTGSVAGTPHYMAPEQALGLAIDHRCDIYSLGVVAYEMFTGTTPFRGDSPVAVLMQHVHDPLPVPARTLVPDALFAVLKQALAKDPRDRWPSAGAFVAALETGAAESPLSRTVRPIAPRVVAAVSAAALAGVAVALLWPSTAPAPTQASPPIETAPVQETSPPAVVASPETTTQPERVPEAVTPSRRPTTAASRTPDPLPVQETSPAALNPPSTTEVRPPEPPSTPQEVASPPSINPEAAAPTPVAPEPSIVERSTPVVATPIPETPAGAVVTQPVRIRAVNPTYPPVARAAQIQGDVLLHAVVGPDGRVTRAEILRSVHPVLDEAARRAVLQYRYTPGLRNGVPDTFTVQITVSFRLQ
jgi:TonB family protein